MAEIANQTKNSNLQTFIQLQVAKLHKLTNNQLKAVEILKICKKTSTKNYDYHGMMKTYKCK